MRATYITAIAIAIAIAAWLLSGQLNQNDDAQRPTLAEQNREDQRVQEDAAPTKVRVAVLQASEQQQLVKVRGKTANKRTVDVKVELNGRIVARPVDRGTPVEQGDVLCKISTEDRASSLLEAREAVNQARLEYQGALSLKAKGFNSETAIAAAKARLAATNATLNRRQLDLAKLDVRAPFSGLVEDVHLEVGDFVTPGAGCATIVDMDPMLLVGRITEQDVAQVKLDQPARGVLRDGRIVDGPVTFIGQQSDPNTRTYPIEVQLPNPQRTLRSGITAEISIPVASVMAQKVSPALLALDDVGDIGIRTINEYNIVEFHNVSILSDAKDGVWVTGLPARAAVITVGQELVSPGERVDPVFLGGRDMPAQNQPEPDANKVASDPNAAAIGLQATLNAQAS